MTTNRWIAPSELDNYERHLAPYIGVYKNEKYLIDYFLRHFKRHRGKLNIDQICHGYCIALQASPLVDHLRENGFEINDKIKLEAKIEELCRIIVSEILAIAAGLRTL